MNINESIIISINEDVDLLINSIQQFFPGIKVKEQIYNFSDGIEILKKDEFKVLFLDVIFLDKFYRDYDSLFNGFLIVFDLSNRALKIINPKDRLCENNISIPVSLVKGSFNLKHKSIYDLKTIPVFENSKINLIKENTVLFIEAKGNKTLFHSLNDELFTSNKNIGAYEKILTHSSLFRTHHKYFVNFNFVTKVVKTPNYSCVLQDGTIIPVSKRKVQGLTNFLNIH